MKSKWIIEGKLKPPRARLKKFWQAENSEIGAGDLKQLQSAIAALDEITKPLAELLMDKAMETMLREARLDSVSGQTPVGEPEKKNCQRNDDEKGQSGRKTDSPLVR